MSQHGKKYLTALAKVDITKFYEPRQALTLVKDTAYAQFDATCAWALTLARLTRWCAT